jgi:hypothetical protein
MFLRNPRSNEEEETKTISSARLLKWREPTILLFLLILKNRNRKVNELEWEMWRTGRGDRRVKEPEWEMWRTGRGGDRRVKEQEWEMWRNGRGGGSTS